MLKRMEKPVRATAFQGVGLVMGIAAAVRNLKKSLARGARLVLASNDTYCKKHKKLFNVCVLFPVI